MIQPTLRCPKCQAEIPLTESLSAPLLEEAKVEYQKRLAEKDSQVAAYEAALKTREEALTERLTRLNQDVDERVAKEKARIASEEARKAALALHEEMTQKSRAIAELELRLTEREGKLTEAQRFQAEAIRKARELDDARQELDLTVEKQVTERLGAIRDQAKKVALDEMQLKLAEREETILALQRQIGDLRLRAEQGSQQLQGEVQELQLETLLRAKFPMDRIVPVPKGEFGGDILQEVLEATGLPCGLILWESKRTRLFSETWLAKLRDDQHRAKADVAILISQALPKAVESFDCMDGVWVVHPRVFIPVAMALRQSLLDVAGARRALTGQTGKMEMVYGYLTGPRFRQRVEAIVSAFSTMKEDLDKERRSLTKQWAKREEQLERVMQATVGMYGDLQGIAGKSLEEIESLALPHLAAGD